MKENNPFTRRISGYFRQGRLIDTYGDQLIAGRQSFMQKIPKVNVTKKLHFTHDFMSNFLKKSSKADVPTATIQSTNIMTR